MGKSLSGRGFAGQNSFGRLQIRKAQASYRQNPGRSGENAREGSDRHDHGFNRRSRVANRQGVLPDVGREREETITEAVDFIRIRRSIASAGATVYKIKSASARVWQFCPRAVHICSRRKSASNEGGHSAA